MSLNYTINLLTSIINWFALRTRVLTMIKNLYLISSIKFIGNSLQSVIQLKFTKKLNEKGYTIRWSDQEQEISVEEKQ